MNRSTPVRILCVGVLALTTASRSGADIVGAAPSVAATFYFAPHDMSYLALLAEESPLIGQEIILTRIYLSIESFVGSDAARFTTDIAFPIKPPYGDPFVLAITGAELGWSGPGTFHYVHETKDFNGTFISMGYGAETFGGGAFIGRVLHGSRIEFITVPSPTSAAAIAAGAGAASLRRRRST